LEGYFAKELIELLSENGNKKCWWWGKTKSLLVPQANIIKQGGILSQERLLALWSENFFEKSLLSSLSSTLCSPPDMALFFKKNK
jgi:hypothetical protein